MKYSIFKDYVLARASGDNVHEVTGALGRVLNCLENDKYWKQIVSPFCLAAQENRKHGEAALSRIKELTGFSIQFDDIK